MKRSKFILGLLLLLLMWGCKSNLLSEEELNAYVLDPDNGLLKESKEKDIVTKVIYRPTDLMIAQELVKGSLADTTKLKELRKKYDKYLYFILSLSKENKDAVHNSGDGFNNFSERLQILSFRMGEYIDLTTSSKETIKIEDYIYPRTFGYEKSTNLMFVFKRDKVEGLEWIEFNMKDIGLGTSDQSFRFETEDILKAPGIDFNTKLSQASKN